MGQGCPESGRITNPSADTAVFVWQGTLERPQHAARVRLPVPRTWLAEAKQPRMRVVCAWNSPANAGARDVWACRKVGLQIRPTIGADAPRARGRAVGAYPLIDREYALDEEHLKKNKVSLDADEWVLDVAYEDVAPYPPLMRVDEQQRVGVVLELFDADDGRVSPQTAVQAMPMTASMVHLGGMKPPIWSPRIIPTSC